MRKKNLVSWRTVMVFGCLLGVCAWPPAAGATETGLGIFEENPRYFSFDGEPIFFASRSFGWTAVSDPDLDYVRDIETTAAYGGNLLRLTLFWPGHGEEGGELPWVRDEDADLYDLDEFNPAYFEHLRHYLSVAREHEAVVNLELFDHPAVKGGAGRWPAHPMNPDKNVNYGDDVFSTSSVDHNFFFTLPEHNDVPVALEYQRELVRKVLDETLEFDHVIYSLGNECPSPVEWNEYWVEFIHDYVAEQDADPVLVTNMWGRDLPVFDVFDAHDAQSPYRVRRMSAEGMWAAYQAIYARQEEETGVKPVYDSGQMGGPPGSHILHQVWMSLVGGTAGMRYHRLAPVFPRPGVSSEVEVGNWEDPHHLEQQRWIENIRAFVDDLEFWTMEPQWDAVAEGEAYMFARPGDEYVVYFPHGGTARFAEPAEPGEYEFRWYNPDTGETHSQWTDEVQAGAEPPTIEAPSEQDWVLHARRQ